MLAQVLAAGVLMARPAWTAAVPSPDDAVAARDYSSSSGSGYDDGYPMPSTQQLFDIGVKADGLAPNGPLPPKVSAAGITNFQLIAFNEQFEVAFFSSLIANITNNVPGYDGSGLGISIENLLEVLETVKAQEELHALSATQLLQHFGAPLVPEPCTYKFPSTDLNSALSLAETFTAVVLGTLQDASQSLAQNGDDAPVRTLASIIGQEGEQNGFYRFVQKARLKPSEKPFLTTSTGSFAFSALRQMFVAECPFDPSQIPIPTFPALSLETPAEPRDMTLTFAADLPGDPSSSSQQQQLFVTYLVGLQTPISVPVSNVRPSGAAGGGGWLLDAFFPFSENVMQGLTLAALTNASGFATADDVPASTLAAPGLIQVNDSLS